MVPPTVVFSFMKDGWDVVAGEMVMVSSKAVPSSCHPSAECSSGVTDLRKIVVVVPAEGFDLLEQVEILEISSELDDEGVVERGIEGIAGEVMFEIVQHVCDAWLEGD